MNEIEDEATPMGAFDEPHCWVHWVMLLGILMTAVYGIIVVRRRLHLADDVDDYEKQVLGIEDEAPEAVPADGRQALLGEVVAAHDPDAEPRPFASREDLAALLAA